MGKCYQQEQLPVRQAQEGGNQRSNSPDVPLYLSTYMAQLRTVKDVQAAPAPQLIEDHVQHYIKSVPESVRVAVESLDHLMHKAPADSGQPAN
jgi:hypothetical protein